MALVTSWQDDVRLLGLHANALNFRFEANVPVFSKQSGRYGRDLEKAVEIKSVDPMVLQKTK